MVSTWQRADMGGVFDAATSIRGIRHIFPRVHAAAGYPADMAIFERFDAERRVVVLYFTTPAQKIAQIYGARPCAPPSGVGGLRLVCGADRCRRVPLPARDSDTTLPSNGCSEHADPLDLILAAADCDPRP